MRKYKYINTNIGQIQIGNKLDHGQQNEFENIDFLGFRKHV